MIKAMPKKAVRLGISFRYKNPIIIATIGLYEFIGAIADKSPRERALMIK